MRRDRRDRRRGRDPDRARAGTQGGAIARRRAARRRAGPPALPPRDCGRRRTRARFARGRASRASRADDGDDHRPRRHRRRRPRRARRRRDRRLRAARAATAHRRAGPGRCACRSATARSRSTSPPSAPDATALLAADHTGLSRVAHDRLRRDARLVARRTRRRRGSPSSRPTGSPTRRAAGPAAIVIGARRWDRSSARARRGSRSSQTPIDVTTPYWTRADERAPRRARTRSRSSTAGSPAWFRVTFDGSRPTVSHMTAAAHFMTDRYVGFDVPATVSPPSR